MDFNELQAAQTFLQVVRSNGFASAARVLGRSPPTVTRQVADLEAHLGAQLLSRTTRRLHLTEAGALYVAHAQGLLTAQRQAHEAVSSLTGGIPRGVLRVTMPAVVGERMLGPHLAAFHRRHPELGLELEMTDRVASLSERGFDLALRVGRLPDSSQLAQRLADVELMMVASPAYLKRRGQPKAPAALSQHRCIVQGTRGGPTRWSFYRGGEVERLQVDSWLYTTSAALVTQAAVAGEGVARVSAWVVRDELKARRLTRVLPGWSCHDPRVPGVGLHAVYAQTAGTPIPLKARVFVAFVREVLAKQPK